MNNGLPECWDKENFKSIYLITGTGKAWAWQRSANPVPSTLLTWIDLYSRVNEGAFALIGSVTQMKEKRVKQKSPELGYTIFTPTFHNNKKKKHFQFHTQFKTKWMRILGINTIIPLSTAGYFTNLTSQFTLFYWCLYNHSWSRNKLLRDGICGNFYE